MKKTYTQVFEVLLERSRPLISNFRKIKLTVLFLVTAGCFLFMVIFSSCAGSSEIITMSSRNISKKELKITGSASLNPAIMPLCHENVDTMTKTSTRIFGNYPLPMNPVLSANLMYGLTNFYEAGIGADLSMMGYTIILNNKIGLSDFINTDKEKRMGFSYYNKSSFSRGNSIFAASYNPFRKGHFEVGNYLLIGFFLKDYELIISPHIDFNYLMSKEHEYYFISNGEVSESCNDRINEKGIVSGITNNNLTFVNYGLNLGLKTRKNLFFEAGFQYIDSKSSFYEPILKSRYQFSLGIGYELKLK